MRRQGNLSQVGWSNNSSMVAVDRGGTFHDLLGVATEGERDREAGSRVHEPRGIVENEADLPNLFSSFAVKNVTPRNRM